MIRVTLLLASFAIVSFTFPQLSSNLNDSRDGRIYKTVQIGKLTVMAENLAYDTQGAFCYQNEERFCAPYGKLYDYKTAIGDSNELMIQGVCPNGWHIPNSNEWSYLIKGLNGKAISQKGNVSYLVSKNPIKLQFAGFRSHHDKRFYQAGIRGLYMTSDTKSGFWTAVEIRRKGNSYKIEMHNKTQKTKGISCRCIKDY